MPTGTRRSATLCWLLLLATAGLIGACRDPLRKVLAPAPEFSPEEVVRIQLEALRNNDEDDRGIALAFRFASTENRRTTGPLPRFSRMIKDAPYAIMLNFQEATYGPIETTDTGVRQRVVLRADEQLRQFTFELSQREFEPCAGCWMTDSVLNEGGVERRI
jgi:hypothetical protein